MPPPPTRHVIKVSEKFSGSGMMRFVQRRRFTVEVFDNIGTDFVCGNSCVLFVDDLHKLNDPIQRQVLSERIKSIDPRVSDIGKHLTIMILVKAPDPLPDTLTWLNLYCSVELHCLLFLCWTEEECSSCLEGLADGSTVSLDYHPLYRKEDAPLPLLIEAFTQTPQLMSRNDVIRASNRFGTPAKLFTAAVEDLVSLTGFGQKKANRLHAVLNAGFHTSRHLVSDVLVSEVDQRGVNETTEATRQSAVDKMMEVLGKLREYEMIESESKDA